MSSSLRARGPDDRLRTLYELRPDGGSLVLVMTRTLAAAPALFEQICATHGFERVDLSQVRSPFEVAPGQARRRLLTGLSWMRPELRAQRAMELNRARDRVGVLGVHAILWIVEEDYRWFCETAPDLASRLSEELRWPEPPVPTAGAGDLLCPLGAPPSSRGVSPPNSAWIHAALAAPGGRVALPHPSGPDQARAVLDRLLADARGPAGWLDLRLLDPERVGRWLDERGDLRLVAAVGGLPAAGWRPEVAVLVCDLPDAEIPDALPRAPTPLDQLGEPARPEPTPELPLIGSLEISAAPPLDLTMREALKGFPEAPTYLVVSAGPDWRPPHATADADPGGSTWTALVEDPQLDDQGRARSWIMVYGPGSVEALPAHRHLWTCPADPAQDDPAALWETLLGGVASSRLPSALRVEIAGQGAASRRFHQIPWERLEAHAPRPVAISRAWATPAASGDPAGVLLFIARPALAGVAQPDPWFIYEALKSALERAGTHVEVHVEVGGSLTALEARLGRLDHPPELLILDAPAVYDREGAPLALLFEEPDGPDQQIVAARAAVEVDGARLAWALRERPVGALLVAGWDARRAPREATRELPTALAGTPVGALVHPVGASPAEALFTSLGAWLGAVAAGASWAEAGRRARAASGGAPLRVWTGEGPARLHTGTAASPDPGEDGAPPPPPGGLVGRQIEILQGIQALDELGTLGIYGLAGQGKAALAAAIARRWRALAQERRVVWLTLDDATSSDDVLTRLRERIGAELAQQLQQTPTLVAVDELERALGPDDAALAPGWSSLLDTLIAAIGDGPSRLLLVSRQFFMTRGASQIIVPGALDEQTGRALLQRRLMARGINEDAARHIALQPPRHALDHAASVVALAEVLVAGGSDAAVQRAEREQMEALERSIRALPRDARARLGTLAPVVRVCPLPVLRALLNGDEGATSRLASALCTVGLAWPVAGGLSLHPALPSLAGAADARARLGWTRAMMQWAGGLEAAHRQAPVVAMAAAHQAAPDLLVAARALDAPEVARDELAAAANALGWLLCMMAGSGSADLVSELEIALRGLRGRLGPRDRLEVDLLLLQREIALRRLDDTSGRAEALVAEAHRLSRHHAASTIQYARALRVAAQIAFLTGQPQKALQHISQALSLPVVGEGAIRPPGKLERAVLLETLASVLAHLGRKDDASKVLDACSQLAMELEHAPLLASVEEKRSRWYVRHSGTRRADLEQQLDQESNRRSPLDEARALRRLAEAQPPNEARHTLAHAIELTSRVGAYADTASARCQLASIAHREGDVALAEQLYLEAEPALRGAAWVLERGRCLAALAALWLAQLRDREAANAADQAVELIGSYPESMWRVAWNGAIAHRRLGDVTRADQLVQRAAHAYFTIRNGGMPPPNEQTEAAHPLETLYQQWLADPARSRPDPD